MTDEQINEAITEATGLWDHPYSNDTKRMYDFCFDLNAMHEAEKTIADKGVNAWWIYCGNIVRSMPAIFGSETAIMATARQRAEAFLKTLGKWKEVQR